MKYFIFFISLIPFSVFAQVRSESQDPEAEPILNQLASQFDTEKALQLEFRYEIYSAAEDATVGDYGSLIMLGNKYKLKTEDTEVLFNGQYLWTYSILNEEVYKSEPTENDNQLIAAPFKLLSEYKKYYKYLYKGSSEIEEQILDEVELYPIDLENEYSMIEVYTQPKSGKLQAMIVKQKNGIEIRIFMKDIIRNIKISDTVFTWDETAHQDVLLIEM